MMKTKEVEQMIEHTSVVADPIDGMWIVTCSDCGALGVCSDDHVDTFMIDHMVGHGAEVPA